MEIIENITESLADASPVLKGAAVMGGLILLLGALSEDGSSAFDREYEQFWNQADYNRTELEEQESVIRDLEKQKQSLEEEKAERAVNQSEQTEKWIEETKQLRDEIAGKRHAMFLPGALEEIDLAMEQTEVFKEKGAGQAAFLEAGNACRMARRDKKIILDREIEWEQAYTAYLETEAVVKGLKELYGAWPVQVPAAEGNEQVTLDVDYWTRGQLSGFYDQAMALTPDRSLGTEELVKRTERLAGIRDRMRDLNTEAVEKFMDAAQRMEMCEAVYHAMQKRGWILDGERAFGHDEDDERQPAFLIMRNAVWDRVSFRFTENGGFHVSVRISKTGNRDLQQYLAEMIRQALNENDFTITDFQTLAV